MAIGQASPTINTYWNQPWKKKHYVLCPQLLIIGKYIEKDQGKTNYSHPTPSKNYPQVQLMPFQTHSLALNPTVGGLYNLFHPAPSEATEQSFSTTFSTKS